MPTSSGSAPGTATTPRIVSVDALRGLVMFLMIFVNDLAGAGEVVPDWMVHFSERHRGGSGMTFVDLVFPAFLFLVGMSVPLALGGRMAKGQTVGAILGHALVRTMSLLWIGILMVHETPDTAALGWSGALWCVLMYLAAIAAFSFYTPSRASTLSEKNRVGLVFVGLRWAGWVTLVGLAFAFRGANGQRIITLSPLTLDTQWYGILGLIGWAYLVTVLIFVVFRGSRTGILGSMVLLLCLFVADRKGAFAHCWLNGIVGIGGTLGSQASISVGGLLLGSALTAIDLTSLRGRTLFTGCFVAGCAAAALLLEGTYGISKNQATPSWCLWACAITAAFWYGFHLISDVRPMRWLSGPLALAGQNVLLAYLLSMMLPSLLDLAGLSAGYSRLAAHLPGAILRSALCGVLILSVSTGLNRVGLRLRL